jgi:hypothetical protein
LATSKIAKVQWALSQKKTKGENNSRRPNIKSTYAFIKYELLSPKKTAGPA